MSRYEQWRKSTVSMFQTYTDPKYRPSLAVTEPTPDASACPRNLTCPNSSSLCVDDIDENDLWPQCFLTHVLLGKDHRSVSNPPTPKQTPKRLQQEERKQTLNNSLSLKDVPSGSNILQHSTVALKAMQLTEELSDLLLEARALNQIHEERKRLNQCLSQT